MSRSNTINLIKALASQVIVLHHLAIYAPMTDWLVEIWPSIIDFFFDQGRLAVQPFLVIGGFLAAKSMHHQNQAEFWPLIQRRYLRLAPPFLMSLVLVVLATIYFGKDLTESEWVSPIPSFYEFIAHVLFMQDILNVPSISAGAWYLAIDLQLFGLLVLMHGCRRKWKLLDLHTPALVAFITLASIHIFSRYAVLDIWAIYFFSAYGLGILVYKVKSRPESKHWFFVVSAMLVIDWILDPRTRPLLALSTAWLLYSSESKYLKSLNQLTHPSIHFLSNISYSLFVCHFAVIIIYSGLWERWEFQGQLHAIGFTLAAWMTSLLLGYAMHMLVQSRIKITE